MRTTLFLLCLIGLWPFFLPAQPAEAHKLHQLLAQRSTIDTTYIRLELELVKAFTGHQSDSVQAYLQQAFQHAQQLEDAYWLGKVYHQKSKAAKKTGNLDAAVVFAQQAVRYFEEAGDLPEQVGSMAMLGLQQFHNEQAAAATETLDQAYQLSLSKGCETCQQKRGGVLEAQGLMAFYQGNIQVALDKMLQARDLFKAADFMRGHGSIANNLGLVYMNSDQPRLAARYFQECKEVGRSINNLSFQAIASLNLGNAYQAQGLDSLAEATFWEGFEIQEKLGNPDQQMGLLNNIGILQRNRGEIQASIETLNRGLNLNPSSCFSQNFILVHVNLSYSFMESGQLVTARKYAGLAWEMGNHSSNSHILMALHELRHQVEAASGNHELAYQRYGEFVAFQDSLEQHQASEELAQLELERTEAEAKQLEAEKAEQALRLDTQRTLIAIGGISLVITLASLFYVLRLLRFRKQAVAALENHAQALRQAKNEAETASRAKAEFLSVMSHEIRTPMNAVIGMTNLLRDEEPRPDQQAHLDILEFSSRHLLSLINDILDFSKIEAGRLVLEDTSLNLPVLLAQVTASMGQVASDKNIELHCECDPSQPAWYRGDPVRLGQIVTNLVSNAIKFTPEGSVTVRMQPSPAAGIRILVEDTGIGIPEDRQQAIFEKFTQSSSDTTRKYGGTGLGLAITKRLLEMMGSHIQLSSTTGQGSTFFFDLELPLAIVPTEGMSPSELPMVRSASLENVRILVAEDNPVNQLVVGKFLDKWGVKVETVDNGAEAITRLLQGGIDLVLMDVQMPVMDGLTAAREIRKLADPALAGLPIIALTASVLKEEKEAIEAADMNDAVFKPFDPKVLREKLERYLQRPIIPAA
jgi:signal transduction histidine kinase